MSKKTVNWGDIQTLPKLDNHNHDELGIVEPGFVVHFMNKNTKLIYTVDEDDLFTRDDDTNKVLVGIYLAHTDEYKIFTDEEKEKIAGLTERDLPKIKELLGIASPLQLAGITIED